MHGSTMKCIYWNTNDIKAFDRIEDLLNHKSPDLLFLSEIKSSFIEVNHSTLLKLGYEYYENPGCDRVSIIKKVDLPTELKLQNYYYTVIRIINTDTFFVSIHLPSQMFQHMKALKEFIRDFRNDIDIEIGSSLEKKIVVIGDFNVNPHEDPMIDFDGFLATNSTNSRKTITHLGKKRATYYNPTWQLYSRKQFPGTKAFNRPSGSSYDILEYHYLDQVVISQYLLSNILNDTIEVIEKTDNFIFYNDGKNKIIGSDHLPLLYQFKII